MNLSEIFIRRPIATSLLMAAIALFGVVAYQSLPVADLPTVDSPTMQIQAGLPGGDPSSMASSVASPIERQLTKDMSFSASILHVGARHLPATLLVTHDVEEAILLADRALVLRDGRIAVDVPIDLPRPRVLGGPTFDALRGQLLRELGVEVDTPS